MKEFDIFFYVLPIAAALLLAGGIVLLVLARRPRHQSRKRLFTALGIVSLILGVVGLGLYVAGMLLLISAFRQFGEWFGETFRGLT